MMTIELIFRHFKSKNEYYYNTYCKRKLIQPSEHKVSAALRESQEDRDSITQPSKQVQTELSSQDKETKYELQCKTTEHWTPFDLNE